MSKLNNGNPEPVVTLEVPHRLLMKDLNSNRYKIKHLLYVICSAQVEKYATDFKRDGLVLNQNLPHYWLLSA